MNYTAQKQELLRLKRELERRLDETQREITHADEPLEQDFAEQAIQRQSEEVTYELDKSARIELLQINRAIERIENGEYGICLNCGEEISGQRLAAIPYTSLCTHCMNRN